MKHYGDITKINGAAVEPVDIITGGSPCQDLSVAGKRAGLAGQRSGLFMEQIRIIKEMRENDKQSGRTDVFLRPRYMVWENVPGAFSSNKGEDFRAVLEETARIADKDAVIPRPPKNKWQPSGAILGDGWSIAWRVHDAQFWGVPQRRKRIALVADFGGTTAPEILFEREGVSGDFETCGKEREDIAANTGAGITETGRAISFQERAGKPGGGKGILIQDERVGALSTLNNQSVCCLNDQGGSQMNVSEDISGTLRAQEHGHQPVVYGISAYESNAMKSSNPHSGIYEAETARTLDLNGGSPACNQGGMAVVMNDVIPINTMVGTRDNDEKRTAFGVGEPGDPQFTISAAHSHAVVCLEGNGSRPSHRGDGYVESETMYTLNSVEHHAVCAGFFTEHSATSRSIGYEEEKSPTLRTGTVPAAIAVENHPADSRVKLSEDGKVQTLSGRIGTGGGNVPMVMEPVYIGNGQADIASHLSKGVSQTLNCMHDQMVVMTDGLDRASYNQGANAKYNFSIEEEKIGAQVARGPGAVCSTYQETTGTLCARISAGTSNQLANDDMFVANTAIVRRLTPLECERLQGFPDNWTNIGEWVDSKGKRHKDADSPRYKALGNSIALPFWEWMAKRMVQYIDYEPTMASLFDGIGGFPLVFSRSGCTPVWASEIEEFPIAVTKRRFPK